MNKAAGSFEKSVQYVSTAIHRSTSQKETMFIVHLLFYSVVECSFIFSAAFIWGVLLFFSSSKCLHILVLVSRIIKCQQTKNKNKQKKRHLGVVCTKFVRSVFLRTARISRIDVIVVLCLIKHYAINNVWRVELYLHVPASQHTRVEPLIPIR